MGDRRKVVIHTNPTLYNQTSFAAAFVSGFREHGIDAKIVGRNDVGDIHIVQGPHYAFARWKHHPMVLHLDRCFYGDAATVVSLGWLNPDGSRRFAAPAREPKGALPEIQPAKKYRGSAVVLGDYAADSGTLIEAARKRFERVYFKPHPQGATYPGVMNITGGLDGVFNLCDVAVGHRTSALVAAALAGLYIVTTDKHHACKPIAFGFDENERIGEREEWLAGLSWQQWSLSEIKSGEFWSSLKCQSPLLPSQSQNQSSLQI